MVEQSGCRHLLLSLALDPLNPLWTEPRCRWLRHSCHLPPGLQLLISTSAAIADSLLRRAFGRQARRDSAVRSAVASQRMSGLALTVPSQLNCVADSNVSAPDHETIQSERAAESPHDIRKHLTILFQTVRIKRRHDAAPAEILDSDNDVSDVQTLPRP